ncbi:MAG: hypothetical protein Q4C56_04710 [Peptococcaceae bacterium]|nr:hypothetical protein [Peptococcaceae bacterium]
MNMFKIIRRILVLDIATNKRHDAGLMRNSLWDGVYDRSGQTKDGYGAVPGKKAPEGSHR